MNITNIIIELQKVLNVADDAQTLMIIAKAIDKLKVGSVTTITSTTELPDLPLAENGFVYLNETSEELYFNLDSEWLIFPRTAELLTYAWGRNNEGQLGDSSSVFVNKSSPVTIAGGITDWAQVSAGYEHSLGITTTGIAYAWGSNSDLRLGDGTNAGKSSPVTVVGGITNWTQVSAGETHSLGVTATGIAYGWGGGSSGQIGDNESSVFDRSSPVIVVGGITNWTQVSAGDVYSLGVNVTGIAYAWGYNSLGNLGDSTTIDRSSPVTVVGGITDWAQVSAGVQHSLGVTDGGIAYAWGLGSYGRLGDDTTVNKSSPVTVVGGITNWSQVSAGNRHSLGVTDSGIAYAWGSGGDGRLGDDTTVNKSSPVTIVGGITNWGQVSAGFSHSLGVTNTGVAYAWGINSAWGQVGDNTTTNKSSPVTVTGGITTWTQVSAGGDHSLAATTGILKL